MKDDAWSVAFTNTTIRGIGVNDEGSSENVNSEQGEVSGDEFEIKLLFYYCIFIIRSQCIV